MKKYNRLVVLGLTVLFFTLAQAAQAQSRFLKDRVSADRWSVEAQVGAGLPVFDRDSTSVYSRPSAQFGVRYMLTQTWGAKLHYGYHDFSERPVWNRPEGAYHFTMHQYSASLVHSLSDYFGEERILGRRINVLVHAGLSYSQGRYWGGYAGLEPDTLATEGRVPTDAMVTALLGSTFQFKPRWSKRVVFTADLTLHYNAFQNKRFDGTDQDFPKAYFGRVFDPNLFIVPSIGVQYHLGRNDWHVDWR